MMTVKALVEKLQARKDKIDSILNLIHEVVPVLEDEVRVVTLKAEPKTRGRHKLTKAQRAEISKRMKAYWRQRNRS